MAVDQCVVRHASDFQSRNDEEGRWRRVHHRPNGSHLCCPFIDACGVHRGGQWPTKIEVVERILKIARINIRCEIDFKNGI
jgi:hypothetical protein